MLDKEEYIIRIIELVKKIKEYYEIIKAEVIRTLSGTKAECTLPIDTDELEIFVRCIWSDIRTFFSKEENIQNCRLPKPEKTESAHLTESPALSDNKDTEILQSYKGEIKI